MTPEVQITLIICVAILLGVAILTAGLVAVVRYIDPDKMRAKVTKQTTEGRK